MQQSKARNVSSRLCRAVNGVWNSKSLCLIFFRTRAMCCVACAECHVTSMEGPPYRSKSSKCQQSDCVTKQLSQEVSRETCAAVQIYLLKMSEV
ncbi:hypothetical protein PoB_005798500 [Plakobranchus ocellatus]|uniref:Uncharacterized protein n=1 Tax=Plakobranchus ocellatus TaxID=259542 RepID=A0AAV4CF84_9GAST|nr:hypothetical protein PoB_005798500 [Plakobranchus ocellatus]